MNFSRLWKLRIQYRVAQALIVLFAVCSALADSMSPFLSATLDGFFAVLIIIVVALMRAPGSGGNGPQAKA